MEEKYITQYRETKQAYEELQQMMNKMNERLNLQEQATVENKQKQNESMQSQEIKIKSELQQMRTELGELKNTHIEDKKHTFANEALIKLLQYDIDNIKAQYEQILQKVDKIMEQKYNELKEYVETARRDVQQNVNTHNKEELDKILKNYDNHIKLFEQKMHDIIDAVRMRQEKAEATHMHEIEQQFGVKGEEIKLFMEREITDRKEYIQNFVADLQQQFNEYVGTESNKLNAQYLGVVEQINAEFTKLNANHKQSTQNIQVMIQELRAIPNDERVRIDAIAKELLDKIETEHQTRLKQIEADVKQFLTDMQAAYTRMHNRGEEDMHDKMSILTEVEQKFTHISQQIQEKYAAQKVNIKEMRQMLSETRTTKEQISSQIIKMNKQNQETIGEIDQKLVQATELFDRAINMDTVVQERINLQNDEFQKKLLEMTAISATISDSKQAIERKINEMNELESRLQDMMATSTSSIDAKLEELKKIQEDVAVNSDRAHQMYNKIETENARFNEALQTLYDTEHKKLKEGFAEASTQSKKVMSDIAETQRKIEIQSRVIRTYVEKAIRAQKIASASNKKAKQLTLNAEAQRKQVIEILGRIYTAHDTQKKELLEQKTHMEATLASLVKQSVEETLQSIEQTRNTAETIHKAHAEAEAETEAETETETETEEHTKRKYEVFQTYTPLPYSYEQKYVPILYMSDNMARDTLNRIKQYFANGNDVRLKVNTTIMLYNIVNRKPSTLEIIMKDVDKKYNEEKNTFVGLDKQTVYNKFYLMNLRYHMLNVLLDTYDLDATKKIPTKYIPSFDPAIMAATGTFVRSIIKNIEKQTKNIDRIEYMDGPRISILYKKIIASIN